MNLWDRKAHDLQPIRPNVKMARDPGNEVVKKLTLENVKRIKMTPRAVLSK